MTLTFSTVLMFLSFQILMSSVAFCRASAACIFMSFVQSLLQLQKNKYHLWTGCDFSRWDSSTRCFRKKWFYY